MLQISSKSTSDRASDITIKCKPSRLNLSTSKLAYKNDSSRVASNESIASSTSPAAGLLSPRSPKSITKTRRSSVTTDHHLNAPQSFVVQQQDFRSKSQRNSMVHVTPQQMPSSPTATLSEKLETFNFNYKHKNHSSSSSNTIENSGSSNRSNATDSRSTRSSSSKSSSESVTENFIINPLAIQAINSLNGHSSSTVHKNKSTRSAKKLDQFFVKHQQSTKEILCLEEIKKRGLKAILESKAPLCYFLYHSLEEYNSENLFFYLELRQYELFTYSSLGQQTATAKHIFDTYLTNNSFLEVNLDDDIRVTIFKLIEKRQPTLCFDTAKGAIFNLLESSYMRFQNTETFQEMLHYCCCDCETAVTTASTSSSSSYCSGSSNHHHHHHRHPNENKAVKVAIKKLKSYIEFEHRRIFAEKAVLTMPAIRKTMLKRHELLKSMIVEFCKSFMGTEISIK